MKNRTRALFPTIQFYIILNIDKKPWLRLSVPVIRWLN